jgi:hypothetical protein
MSDSSERFSQTRIPRIASFIIPLVLIAAFVVSCLGGISYMSPTRDEARHLVWGIMLLKTGDYRLNKQHPFLANALNAVPLLFLDDLRLPSEESEAWKKADILNIYSDFVELNGQSLRFTRHVLNRARFVSVGLMAMTGVILFVVI